MRNKALFFSSPRLELHTPFALRAKCCVRPAWLIQRLIYRLEQTSICTQLFAGHLVGFRPMRRKKNLYQMVTFILCDSLAFDWFCMASKANKFILFFIDLFHISLKAHKCCIKQVKICRKLCRYATVVDYL